MQNQLLQDIMCANFQAKRTTFTFSDQICLKRILGSEFRNSKPGFGISTSNIPWAPIFRQNGQFWVFGPNLFKKEFWGRNFEILGLDSESAPPIYHEHQFSGKMDNFEFWPKFAQKRILRSEFRNSKPGFGISTSNILWVPIFRQNGQLWIFGPNFPKKGFWGWNFKILSLDSESAPPICHDSQFLGKTDNFEFSA